MPNLKKQVEDIETDLLDKEKESSLKEDLEPSKKGIQKTKTSKKIYFSNFGKFTLAIALIIAIGSIWFFSNSPNQKLYNKYFKPESGLPKTDTIDNSDFYNAMSDYKSGNYNKAINKWLILNKDKPNNDTLNYFLGVAKMANKNVADAIPFLERCVAENSFSLLNNAYYYLGLAYLDKGNTELAKKYLSLSKNVNSKEILLKLTN